VLWLCGPPGVGKTTVGWELYTQLLRSGIAAGYVDIDQLGICYPEPPSDPGRHHLKARNLAALVAGFRDAGVGCVVVSGVVDIVDGVQADHLPQAALTVCRLRADVRELKQRFVGRGMSPELVENV
jgi:broad-specificity NMP kinase